MPHNGRHLLKYKVPMITYLPSNEYINFLKENQIRQSMDGKSRWADNIMIERWFRSFKYEEAYLTQYNNIREARKAIGNYVHTYNFEGSVK